MSGKDQSIFRLENTIQPISDDYSSDGFLDDFARVDHQHPLSASLKAMLSGSQSSRRNLFDNGAMNVCQRSTSLAGVTTDSGQRVVDRWIPRNNALGTYTFSQTVDAVPGTEFSNCLKMLCTVIDAAPAIGDFLVMQQNIEGQFLQHLLWGTSSAKPITLSFWVKSNLIGQYVAEFINIGGANRQIGAYYTIKVANTWEYKTITFPGDTIQAITNDNVARLAFTFWLAGGATYTGGASLQTAWGANVVNARAVGNVNLSATVNNFIEFTGLQLEVGNKASVYETRRFQDELETCQRYYETSYVYGTAPGAVTSLGSARAQCFDAAVLTRVVVTGTNFNVRKRVVPTTIQTWGYSGAASVIETYNAPGVTIGITTMSTATDRDLSTGNIILAANAVLASYYMFQWAVSADI